MMMMMMTVVLLMMVMVTVMLMMMMKMGFRKIVLTTAQQYNKIFGIVPPSQAMTIAIAVRIGDDTCVSVNVDPEAMPGGGADVLFAYTRDLVPD